MRGIALPDMYEKMGVKRSTYNNWEIGTEPDIATIKKLAGIFDVHYTQIIDGVDFDFSAVDSINKSPRKALTTFEMSQALHVIAKQIEKISSGEPDLASEPGPDLKKDKRKDITGAGLSGNIKLRPEED